MVGQAKENRQAPTPIIEYEAWTANVQLKSEA